MQIEILTLSGSTLEGVILSVSATTMRVAISGCDDAVEFRFHGGIWFWEGRAPVEIQLYERPYGYDAERLVSVGSTASMDCGKVQTAWVN